MEKGTPVLVCDSTRGIYFGFLEKEESNTVVLKKARHCYYYCVNSAGEKGTYSLATCGPGEDSKIGPEITIKIFNVANITECSQAAVKQWTAAKW